MESMLPQEETESLQPPFDRLTPEDRGGSLHWVDAESTRLRYTLRNGVGGVRPTIPFPLALPNAQFCCSH